MHDLAHHVAGTLLADTAAVPPLSAAAVLALCSRRGVLAVACPELRGWACYVPPPDRLLLYRPGAPAWVLAHELAHDMVAESDPDTLAGRWDGTEEQLADAVATLLCGPQPAACQRRRREPRPPLPEPPPLPAPPLPQSEALSPELRWLIRALCQEARERRR